MTGLSVLLLGLGLGLRHATDADHVVVISTLLEREPGAGRAARIAALWGLGHTAAFFVVGALVVVLGVRLPPQFDRYAALLVAAMLVGLGAWHLRRTLVPAPRPKDLGHGVYARPVAIGVVHGLAGSAAIALLAATTIASRAWAAVYLGLFGLGTIVGMVLLTILLSWPIAWTMRRDRRAPRIVGGLAALCSLALGALVAVEALRAN